MNIIAGGFHQHFAHIRAAQFQQGLPAADVDHLDMLTVEGIAQLLLDREFLAARDDQQPLIRAQPLQRHLAVGDHGQRHWQFQAQGLEHTTGERWIAAVAAQGQMTEKLVFPQGHPGVLAAFADQAGQVGVMQWRLGFDVVAGALLVDVDRAHYSPALNSIDLAPRYRGAG
ncbi:hypothetical protein D3C84_898850 [compost metagenome]